ncbi:MAG: hypothetical protein LBF01_01415, partial [Bacteroidales bacterium]|nr:hypothetical protein [Bacteroidales bacterium]
MKQKWRDGSNRPKVKNQKKMVKNIVYIGLVCFLFLSYKMPEINSGQTSVPSSNSTDNSQENNETSITDRRGDPDTANWNIETLDAAKDVDYLSAIEKDVVLEMNKVRTDPKKYAKLYIRPRLKHYSGKDYYVSEG